MNSVLALLAIIRTPFSVSSFTTSLSLICSSFPNPPVVYDVNDCSPTTSYGGSKYTKSPALAVLTASWKSLDKITGFLL
jgi:hypothetical protein